METKTMQLLLDTVKNCGAYGAAYLTADQIVLDAQFRKACESNSCGRYGRCYQCPPDLGQIEELMARVREYPGGVLYQSVGQLEDSFDFEGMMDAAVSHMQLSQRIQKTILPLLGSGFLHLSSGCRLCKRCAKEDNLPCRYPDTALGAMEGYGMDVYRTVESTPLNYINGKDTVTYFGIILFAE